MMSACLNDQHDHLTTTDFEGALLPDGREVPMLCLDCKRPMHYDYDIEDYQHDDRDAVCHLVGPSDGPATDCFESTR